MRPEWGQVEEERTTPGFHKDDHHGFITWKVPIKTGRKHTLDIAYSVARPEDWTVQ